MKTLAKIAIVLGGVVAAYSGFKSYKKARKAVCSPLMQDFLNQAVDELRKENPSREPTDEEVFKRAGEKVREFQERN